MEAIIVYADGTEVEVEDLTEFADEVGRVYGTENVYDLVHIIFRADARVSEIRYDPQGVEVVYTPERDDFAEGYGTE